MDTAAVWATLHQWPITAHHQSIRLHSLELGGRDCEI